jgi:hypothetical protein
MTRNNSNRSKALLASALSCAAALLLGCTTFHVRQNDESPERKISLDIQGFAWFSGAQNITKLKAVQTDKTQSFGTDQIGMQGPTNTIAALQSIVKILELLRPMP